MSNIFQTLRKVRETAQKNSKNEWDFDAIFNREIYPALRALFEGIVNTGTFPPVRLSGASNAITTDHQHVNLLVSHDEVCELTLSEDVSRQMPEGTILLVCQDGAGQLSLAPGAGVTIRTTETLKLKRQNAEAWLLNIGTLEWILFGEVEEIPVNAALLIQDRFIGGAESVSGNSTNANIGQLQWNAVQDTQPGSITRVAAQAEHPGIIRIAGHATLGSRQSIYLGHAAVSGSVVETSEIDYIEWVVRHVQNRFRFGIGSDAAAPGFGNDRVVIGGDKDITAFWAVGNANGGVASAFTTAIPITTDWITWRVQFVSSSELRFFADGDLVYTSTTNVPSFTALMAPAIQVVTVTPGPFQGIGEVDLFTLQLKT